MSTMKREVLELSATEIVRDLRDAKGMRNADLAKETGIGEATLSKLYGGKSSSEETYRKLARIWIRY